MWDHFQESVPMSTYLVAFAVSDFSVTNVSEEPLNRIWTSEATRDQIGLASEIAPKVLTFFEEYFGTKFPLPKQVRERSL